MAVYATQYTWISLLELSLDSLIFGSQDGPPQNPGKQREAIEAPREVD